VCICSDEFKNNSPNFNHDIVESSPIPPTVLFFNSINVELLEFLSFHINVKAIYHFMDRDNKVSLYL
jgi:hypothetical protein